MKIDSIDIFCQVIDNYGDVGVAYRLAREFKRVYPNKKLRFVINKTEELNLIRKSEDIEIILYKDISKIENSADLIIESFGCEIPKKYMDKALKNSKLIINLEYFSAEKWVDDFHLQESFLGGNLKKYFFIPGLSEKSGGILLDNEFLERKKKVEANKEYYLEKFGIKEKYDLIGSVFSYEKNFDSLIEELKKLGKKIILLILSEKTQKNFIKYFDNGNNYDKIKFVKLPFFTYDKYEDLLALCDFNLVRGEDSFVRALLLGKPFLWHIYPQDENTHIEKLESFLEKYCSNNKELKQTFINYNINKDDFSYFFKNFKEIEKYNKNYANYLIKNCDLMEKLINFIENIGGKN
ncbi:elongation factor P maturation arginine rhamnosyltransferase EarP [Fusobacterium nucleatum]|uniref:elongation factor P maturation arginine rhamnosyltransferase EarP n=1 Tax=Fusobacterium nucleatum TaxID=851 RepID=UPI00235E35DF|nr:elongation factor P maturation arginine rhamnosyltransferase EarP [Fusobacterium nucleatum]WDD88215.1 elongation factor P maturation arginine rhamnosyltransferase EarP [Fusobacterium nucleatum]